MVHNIKIGKLYKTPVGDTVKIISIDEMNDKVYFHNETHNLNQSKSLI